MKNKRIEIKADRITSCIVHLADSANFKGVASNKLCNGLTDLCFESPNDTIHVTVMRYNTTNPKVTNNADFRI